MRLSLWIGTACALLAALGYSQTAPAKGAGLPNRMYVFGDSYSDTGEGYLDGNGPTAVAYLAKRLGFQLFPSTAADLRGKSVDYAVSGAQSGRGDGRRIKGALLGYGMRNQVDDFVAKVRSHEISFDPATTLFFLLGGLNDGKLPEGTTAANEADEIRTLYAAGARRFEVALLTTEIPGFGVTGRRINPSLMQIPATLQHDLPGADIRLSRWGMFYDAVLAHPERYGIINTTDRCAGKPSSTRTPRRARSRRRTSSTMQDTPPPWRTGRSETCCMTSCLERDRAFREGSAMACGGSIEPGVVIPKNSR